VTSTRPLADDLAGTDASDRDVAAIGRTPRLELPLLHDEDVVGEVALPHEHLADREIGERGVSAQRGDETPRDVNSVFLPRHQRLSARTARRR
jgi:hypothetical protein